MTFTRLGRVPKPAIQDGLLCSSQRPDPGQVFQGEAVGELPLCFKATGENRFSVNISSECLDQMCSCLYCFLNVVYLTWKIHFQSLCNSTLSSVFQDWPCRLPWWTLASPPSTRSSKPTPENWSWWDLTTDILQYGWLMDDWTDLFPAVSQHWQVHWYCQIVNRHPPFGNQIRESIIGLPKYEASLEQV